MRVRIEPILESFEEALALVDDKAQRERFGRVVTAARASVERAVHDLVAELVAGANEAWDGEARLDLRYDASGLSVEASRPASSAARTEDDESFVGDLERLTVRLPSDLKDLATAAAAQATVSMNSWLVRTVAHAVTQTLRESTRGVEREARRVERKTEREERLQQRQQQREQRHRARDEQRESERELRGWIGE